MSNKGLYIHIPFCDGKCYYCNFFSKKSDLAGMDAYTAQLIRSINDWSDRVNCGFDTVYFGGGTPSLLGHDRLAEILRAVRSAFSVAADAEITVEVNPSSTGSLDFSALRNAGFNRLSIGLQSANDHELCLIGRRHCADDAYRTVRSAQAAGFDNISLDVMLAIPEQTVESLHRTIDFCAACHVRHISSYILKIEPGTRFYRQKDQLPLFDDDSQAALYEEAVSYLEGLGYRQYEISNFAHPGFESRHNLKYWHDEEYLGLGPSAHSFLNGKRFFYDLDFQAFYDGEIIDEGTGGDPEEYIMLALRLKEGLIFDAYEKRFGVKISDRMLSAAELLKDKGFVRLTASSLSLTVKGFLVSNTVIGYLLQNT